MFYYIFSTTYQKIGDLFCPVHISGLSHSVKCYSWNHQSTVRKLRCEFRTLTTPFCTGCIQIMNMTRNMDKMDLQMTKCILTRVYNCKQDWKDFQVHMLRNEWQILKITIQRWVLCLDHLIFQVFYLALNIEIVVKGVTHLHENH